VPARTVLGPAEAKEATMGARDVEASYSVSEFAAKLRRLADALESDPDRR
jgi:hypothetical protein